MDSNRFSWRVSYYVRMDRRLRNSWSNCFYSQCFKPFHFDLWFAFFIMWGLYFFFFIVIRNNALYHREFLVDLFMKFVETLMSIFSHDSNLFFLIYKTLAFHKL